MTGCSEPILGLFRLVSGVLVESLFGVWSAQNPVPVAKGPITFIYNSSAKLGNSPEPWGLGETWKYCEGKRNGNGRALAGGIGIAGYGSRTQVRTLPRDCRYLMNFVQIRGHHIEKTLARTALSKKQPESLQAPNLDVEIIRSNIPLYSFIYSKTPIQLLRL